MVKGVGSAEGDGVGSATNRREREADAYIYFKSVARRWTTGGRRCGDVMMTSNGGAGLIITLWRF